jgi:hypothetical protein
MPTINIHERAREIAAQSRGRLTVAAAYIELSRRAQAARTRRKNYGATAITARDRLAFRNVEPGPSYRLPYADN